MTTLQALFLGILQGLGEFLPISSSAHLALAPWVFGWHDPGLSFDVALHAGTLAALLWYFRAEWVRLLSSTLAIIRTRSIAGPSERRLVYIMVATIPGGIAGLLLEHKAEAAFRAPTLIAIALIVMGVLLWLVDRYAASRRTVSDITLRDSIAIGIAQAFAIIPGISRSGSTITAGRSLGLDRESAAVFSFLMSMPIIAAAALLKLPHLFREGLTAPLIVGMVSSAVSGVVAIAIVLRYVRTRSYGVFALYRCIIGIGVLVLVVLRARHG